MLPFSHIQQYGIPAGGYTYYPGKNFWNTPRSLTDSILAHTDTRNLHGFNGTISIRFPTIGANDRPFQMPRTAFRRPVQPHGISDYLIREWDLYAGTIPASSLLTRLELSGESLLGVDFGHLPRLISHIRNGFAGSISEVFQMAVEINPFRITPHHLEGFFEMGFRHLKVGMQDFSTRQWGSLNPGSFDRTITTLNGTARAIGFECLHFELYCGLPLQKLSDVFYTISRLNDWKPDRVSLLNFSGHNSDFSSGIERTLSSRDMQMYKLTLQARERLAEIGYREINHGHFALPSSPSGCTARGFSFEPAAQMLPREFKIGLGPSAMTDLWTVLASNPKSCKKWKKSIEKNHLPVCRGHVLTPEDLIVRRHIHNLQSSYETSWEASELRHSVIEQGIMRLRQAIIDGLVELQPFRLTITPEGRPYVDLICRALDARYWRLHPMQPLV